MSQPKRSVIYSPLVLSIVLIGGVLIGSQLNIRVASDPQAVFGLRVDPGFDKINDVINYIDHEYVDDVSRKELVDETIQHLLQQLDPHSYYISAEELQSANESLEGQFEGIGVQFNIQEDTVIVISPISGGPSEKAGIQSGDRIVKANGELIAGVGITNKKVMGLLKGQKGSEVTVSVHRKGADDLLEYSIVRDKIPIASIDAAYMLTPEVGYIKVNKFSKETAREFREAGEELRTQGLQKLILDLRGNGGGYLEAATQMVDELLPEKQLIVYTEGRAREREVFTATAEGNFESTDLVVLIDEGSASASEIVAGAIQDNDRGTLIGRRSFGKGLVQEQSSWPDGSATRLTIARYYTPSGRCIQKPYDKGAEQYYTDYYDRVTEEKYASADSLDFPDSLKFTTTNGRLVYGGGGILPDILVAPDTSGRSFYFTELLFEGVFSQFAFDYVDQEREQLSKFTKADEFTKQFNMDNVLFERFLTFAETMGVKRDKEGLKKSERIIKNRLTALIARNLFSSGGYFQIINQEDPAVNRALESFSTVGR